MFKLVQMLKLSLCSLVTLNQQIWASIKDTVKTKEKGNGDIVEIVTDLLVISKYQTRKTIAFTNLNCI